MIEIKDDSALIIVDVQVDFCPEGALPVPEGDKVVEPINRVTKKFKHVFATRDWHPENHISFRERGGQWPRHCVKGTKGADFHPELKLQEATQIISKATESNKEAYSGFEGTDLAEKLKKLGIKRVFVGGLATDYCVLATVLDAIKYGFETYLIRDATKGVTEQGEREAIKKMEEAGAKIITSEDL